MFGASGPRLAVLAARCGPARGAEPLRSMFSPRWRPADEAGTTLGPSAAPTGDAAVSRTKRCMVRDLSCALTTFAWRADLGASASNHAIDRPVRANADLDVHCCRKQRAVPFFCGETAALGGPDARRQARCLSLQQRDDMAGANVEPPLRLDLAVRQQFRRWRLRSERRSICR